VLPATHVGADGLRPLTLMTVLAHPDDESLFTGGVMARYAAEGLRVVCVTCTRGENGEIVAPELDSPENRFHLGEIRGEELARALDRLGPIENHWLGYRDSGMMGTPENDDPRSFWHADLEEATGRLVRIVRTTRPDVIVSFNDFGSNGHPDHIRAAQIAKAAYARAGDPAAFPEQLIGDEASEAWTPAKLYEVVRFTSRTGKVRRLLATDGLASIPVLLRLAVRWQPWKERSRSARVRAQRAITTQVDVGPWLEAKHAALAEHRTQAESVDQREDPGGARYKAVPTEAFTLVSSRVKTSYPEVDLFAGLRPTQPA
jgi:mycothiol S-conjugate amidase